MDMKRTEKIQQRHRRDNVEVDFQAQPAFCGLVELDERMAISAGQESATPSTALAFSPRPRKGVSLVCRRLASRGQALVVSTGVFDAMACAMVDGLLRVRYLLRHGCVGDVVKTEQDGRSRRGTVLDRDAEWRIGGPGTIYEGSWVAKGGVEKQQANHG